MGKNNIGKEFKKIREEKGLNQLDFASKLDVSQGYLSKIERGLLIPNILTVIKIKKKFNIDLNRFYEGNK